MAAQAVQLAGTPQGPADEAAHALQQTRSRLLQLKILRDTRRVELLDVPSMPVILPEKQLNVPFEFLFPGIVQSL